MGLNKVMLIGNVGDEPEVRVAGSGNKVAKVRLATNRTYKDASGAKREDTQWHGLTFFGQKADLVEQYVNKGDRIYVEGRIEYSQSEGQDGVTRYWTDVIVNDIEFLGGGTTPVDSTSDAPF